VIEHIRLDCPQNKKKEGVSERTSEAENTPRRKHQGEKKRARREKKKTPLGMK
jgi:hypothetical protein